MENSVYLDEFFSERVIHKEALKNTMQKIWKTSLPFYVQSLGTNMYVIRFDSLRDKEKISCDRPWLFDNYLFNLQLFDGCTPPSRIDFHEASFWMQMHDLPILCMNQDTGMQT